jgi:hypothetical protein
MKENSELLIYDIREVDLEIYVEETKCMLLSRHQITCLVCDMKITGSLKICHS